MGTSECEHRSAEDEDRGASKIQRAFDAPRQLSFLGAPLRSALLVTVPRLQRCWCSTCAGVVVGIRVCVATLDKEWYHFDYHEGCASHPCVEVELPISTKRCGRKEGVLPFSNIIFVSFWAQGHPDPGADIVTERFAIKKTACKCELCQRWRQRYRPSQRKPKPRPPCSVQYPSIRRDGAE